MPDPFSQMTPGDPGLRTWTDSTGAYRIEARLVGVAGSLVRLRCADGRFVRVRMDRLSAADQRLVLAEEARVASIR